MVSVDYRIIPYARGRMAERGVPEEAVRWVLENYDIHRPAGPRPGSKPAEIYVGAYQGRKLRVYVERGSSPKKVTTVAWEDGV